MKHLLRRAADRVRRAGGDTRPGAVLSVVVDVGERQLPFLEECLASVGATDFRVQVVVSPYGDAERMRAALAHLDTAAGTIVLPAAADRTTARREGVRAAGGEYVALVSASDVVPRNGLGRLAASLEESGSDLAVGRLIPARAVVPVSRLRPDAPRRAVGPAELPEAFTDLHPGNRVFRRRLWDEPAPALLPDDPDFDMLTAALGYLRARAFDVVPEPAYRRYQRAVGAPIGTITPAMPHLASWLEQVRVVEDELTARRPALRPAWARAMLDAAVQPFLADVEAADPEQWADLRAAVAGWAARARAGGTWEQIAVEHRTRAELALQDRRSDLERFLASRWYDATHLPTTVDGGIVRADWQVYGLGTDGLPDDAVRLAPWEPALVASVRGWQQTGRLRCRVDLWAFVKYVDLADRLPTLTARLVHEDGTAVTADVTRSTDRAVNLFGRDRYQDYAPGCFALELDLAPVLQREGRWDLDVHIDAAGITAAGGPTHLFTGGGAPAPLTFVEDAGGGPRELVVRGRRRQPLVVRVSTGSPGSHAASSPAPSATAATAGDPDLAPYYQERMLVAALAQTGVEEDAAYFESYAGRTATDSPRAVHEEVRARGLPIRCYWGVRDDTVDLPEGAIPLVIGSAEWFRLRSRSRYLINNLDFERRFRKRPGQVFCQTFHGYPSKSMGLGLWQQKNYSPLRVRAELQRTRDDWDLIVTPTAEMAKHYREQYDYDGAIFDRGLPRNDALCAPDADDVRRRTRELLGIEPGRTAVLYAPTWRDDLASAYDRSPSVNHLDTARAAAALGPDFVLLLRGHRFADGDQELVDRAAATHARVVDVGDHPEINELVLAADVGVFDYSSLRFDFAITGRPMLFCVPDLEDYTRGGRGFLFDYTESAPGPLLHSTDEVVAALRDLDGVREQYAEEYAAFNRRFNPHHDGHAAARLVDELFSGRWDVP